MQQNPFYQHLSSMMQLGFHHYGHPCVDLRFFGPKTLATMHQADDLGPQSLLAHAGDSAACQFGVLDSSFVFNYETSNVLVMNAMFLS